MQKSLLILKITIIWKMLCCLWFPEIISGLPVWKRERNCLMKFYAGFLIPISPTRISVSAWHWHRLITPLLIITAILKPTANRVWVTLSDFICRLSEKISVLLLMMINPGEEKKFWLWMMMSKSENWLLKCSATPALIPLARLKVPMLSANTRNSF